MRLLASFCCTAAISLDGTEPLENRPITESDYRESYGQFWREMKAWLDAEGIEPLNWPPPDWWFVAAAATFHYGDVAKVAAWLADRGITVFNYTNLPTEFTRAHE